MSPLEALEKQFTSRARDYLRHSRSTPHPMKRARYHERHLLYAELSRAVRMAEEEVTL